MSEFYSLSKNGRHFCAILLNLLSFFFFFSSLPPNCFINQFPGENVLTCKDLLATVSKNIADGNTPKWLPETYNLLYELPRFVHRYKTLKAKYAYMLVGVVMVITGFINCSESDNTWIIKPWNLGRGMDTHITQNLVQVIRLVNTIPKVSTIVEPVIVDPLNKGHDKNNLSIKEVHFFPIVLIHFQPLKRGQPLYKGQNGWSQLPMCPLFGGSTVVTSVSLLILFVCYFS